ncbi:unnamed protein product [Caenorhabditis auriculariae]|uniref:Uncharacterized protein n=1 Tax=Caenorhabditis auriculariae TaxID=2777116 RepID=A0A8S1HB25_9PELO|nr:unnamed protein product [Caenorhabditis auriculariae]
MRIVPSKDNEQNYELQNINNKNKMGAVEVDPQDEKPRSCSDAMFGKTARKWAFIFIVTFLACLTIKDLYQLVSEYFDYPKESEINIMFNDSMTMPNVTFCMSRTQAWSHFKINESAPADEWDAIVEEELANMTTHDDFMSKPWDFRLVMEAYDMIATYNSLERETTAHGSARSIHVFRVSPRLAAKRKTFKKWHDVLKSRGVTFEEFTQKAGTEVLRRSMQRFQRTSFKEDLVIKTKLRTSWISMMQICFQPMFDGDNFYSIEDQGNFFTMMLSHNADNLDGKSVDCMSVDFHGRPSSLNRFMEGKGRVRDGFADEVCAGQRHELTVEVESYYQMLENDEPGTACQEVEEDEDTEFDCRSRCRMQMIRDICNCTGHSLSYLANNDLGKYPLCDYTQCVLDVQKGNFSDEECSKNCYRDCKQYRFKVNHAVKGRMVRPDLTLVELSWGSFEYLTMEQHWKYTIASFIASLGGAMGMWLGLSILSLVQGGTYLYSYITNRVVKEKILKKGPSVADMKGKRMDSKDSDFEIDLGQENKKISLSLSANPFGNLFNGEPEGERPSSRKTSSAVKDSFSQNPNGASTVRIN